MATDITARDYVWAAVMDLDGEVTVEEVRREVGYLVEAVEGRGGSVPSRETVRRVLAAMDELGVIGHDRASPYYRVGGVGWRDG